MTDNREKPASENLIVSFSRESSAIEGYRLTTTQSEALWKHGLAVGPAPLGCFLEVLGHMEMTSLSLARVDDGIDSQFLLDLHKALFGHSRVLAPGNLPGRWKTFPNRISGMLTPDPADIPKLMDELLGWWSGEPSVNYLSLAAFHIRFERIHPFQDGNGRIGRTLVLKESVRTGLKPPVIKARNAERYFKALDDGPQELAHLFAEEAVCA